MLLILYRTCTDCNIRENIRDIWPVLRIKHLVCCKQMCLGNRTQMHFTHCDDTIVKIRFLLRIRLMNNSFVALSCCTWLVGIDTRDDQDLIRYLILYLCETVYIITDRIFVICGTWSDDH